MMLVIMMVAKEQIIIIIIMVVKEQIIIIIITMVAIEQMLQTSAFWQNQLVWLRWSVFEVWQ